MNVEKFRNVDLVQQGYYRISVRLQVSRRLTAPPSTLLPSAAAHCRRFLSLPIRLSDHALPPQGLQSGTQAVPLATYPSERKHTLGCDDAGDLLKKDGLTSFIDPEEKAYVTRPFFIR